MRRASYRDAVQAYGADITVPILSGPLLALTPSPTSPSTPTSPWAGCSASGGSPIGLFTYGAQLRVLQDGFIPSYFDANYDVFRAQRATSWSWLRVRPSSPGWSARSGATLVQDKLVFSATLDGPFPARGVFASDPTAADPSRYTRIFARRFRRSSQDSRLPFFVDASYEKYCIGAKNGFFQDLVDPTDAVIGLDINYQTGASVLTLAYNAKWDPAAAKFDVTSSLQASVKF